MIRLALIGCGAWGWRYIPAALEAGNCLVTHVVGVGRSCPDEARQYLRDLTIVNREWLWRDAGHLDELPVDAFILATPPRDRLSTCQKIIESHRPLMIEKPLALTDTEARLITSAADRAGLPLLVNHQHLFAPAYEMLRDIVSSWAPLTVRSAGEGPGPFRDYSPLWDYGPHDVAMILGLADDCRVTWARSFTREGGIGADFELRGENLVGQVTSSNCWPFKVRSLWVQSGENFAQYDDTARDRLQVNGYPVDLPADRPLTLAVRAFAEAVRTGRTDWRFGRFGADVVGILDQAQHLLDRQSEVRHAHH